MKDLWNRLRRLAIERILGVKDTPHRIAYGVFLGFLVGWTPTLGFQIVIYLATATLLRANKVSGVPIVFISNPFTAVPLYYWAWRVGGWVLGSTPSHQPSEDVLRSRVQEAPAELSWFENFFEVGFWQRAFDTLWTMGAELWLGALVMGLVTGIPGYLVTYWAVRRFRERRAAETVDDGANSL
ncbi:MAG: DUF2062 domain-containing protein [Myxococcales bacterium]|nr:DUF2062 domain-containing protein [Myxococcales bacterium]